MELASQVSRGGRLPLTGHGIDGSRVVLLLTAEDGAGDTLRPRLDALGADVEQVHTVTNLLLLNNDGLAKLKGEITRLGAGLVIIGPIVAYLPDKTDMNNASSVRPVLAGLSKIAESTGAAVVIVRHLSKGTKDKALYRGLGSIDFTAAARSVLMVGFDPSNPERRVMAHAKSNLAKTGSSIAYTIRGDKFVWLGKSSLGVEDIGAPADADAQSARDEAKEFLLETLSDGNRSVTEVQAEAAKLHISTATLRRAKADLGVVSKKEPDQWYWSLPNPKGTAHAQGDQGSDSEHLAHLEHL